MLGDWHNHIMFGNAYQNGPTLEVWDARVNCDNNPFYKQLFRLHPNSAAKYFDKDVKSYLYAIPQNARMVLPADDSKQLALHQRFLVLHLLVPLGFSWGVELTLSDLNGTRRRVNITTTQGKQEVKYFSFRYPIDNLKKGEWLFLAIDVHSFMEAFKDQTFRSLDQIAISNPCRLRRIFTMKEFLEFEIPKNYWLAQSIPQEFQLIQMGLKEQTSKQLSESLSYHHSSHSLQKGSPKIAKSQVESPPRLHPKNPISSQIIIENARNRLESLNREEERVMSKSKEMESLRTSNNQKLILKAEKGKPAVVNGESTVSRQAANQSKLRTSKGEVKAKAERKAEGKGKGDKSSKGPQLQLSFKEDSALNIEYEQSSNRTEEGRRVSPSFAEERKGSGREVIEEDRWSEEEKEAGRAISQAIGSITGNFPSTVITRQNERQMVVKQGGGKELELIYDEMVGCYYHPESNTYYDLKN